MFVNVLYMKSPVNMLGDARPYGISLEVIYTSSLIYHEL